MNRRQFLVASGALAAGGAFAADPIPRDGPSKLKLSLAAYSFQRHLNLKGKTKPTMTLDDFVDFAAQHKAGAVELTSYYFADTSPAYVARIKDCCTNLGLEVSGSAVGNNFCVADPVKLRQEIASVKEWTERTAALGGKTLRIFAGTVAKGDDEARAVARAVAAIQEVCEHAAKHRVYMALENHHGITSTAEQLLALVKAVKAPWFGVNLDTGNFHTPDPYADLAKVAPYAVNVQVKTEIQAKGQPKTDADLAKLVGLLKEAKYSGYVALEYEAKDEPREAVPKALDALRKLL